jgi:hypothetical protein
MQELLSIITANSLQVLSLVIISATAVLSWRTERFQRQTAVREALENLPFYKFDTSARNVAQARLSQFSWYPLISRNPLKTETTVAIKFLNRATAKNNASSTPDSIDYHYEEEHFEDIQSIKSTEYDSNRKEIDLKLDSTDSVEVRNSVEDALEKIRENYD